MSMYPEEFISPMRKELTSSGFKELKSAEEVDKAVHDLKGTSLIVVNSMCGCAAGSARPGVVLSLQNSVKPDHLFTVFAGQDPEPTAKARSYFTGINPSSPSMGLLKDGKLVFMLERFGIEGQPPEKIAEKLKWAYNNYCKK